MERSTRQLVLGASRLVVELHDDGALPYLDVRSMLDPSQAFLLPLPAPPAIDGLAMSTHLGRLYDVTWGIAWGSGVPPEGCVVTFSSDALRFRRSVQAVPQVVSDRCWVAWAEGVFSTAATVVNGVETARVPLATRY
jgi:hypothetical protein